MMMNRGFMSSDVFGNRIGGLVTVRPGFAAASARHGLSGAARASMGQSRTEGVEVEPSAENLCGLLKTAIAANSATASGKEWDDFFSALDRLRPVEKENAKWRAEVYNQMAMHCPDDVSRLRSIPGVPEASPKCVRVAVKKDSGHDVSSLIAPYQARGWSVVEVPRKPRKKKLPPVPGGIPSRYFDTKMVQESEVWACPPGESLPKRTSLTAQEAEDLAKSLDQATGPVRSGDPVANACVKDAKVDVAVVEKLLGRLDDAAAAGVGIDVTQDEVDAANNVVDCASKLGAQVAPVPTPLAPGISTGAAVGLVGSAGALAFLVL